MSPAALLESVLVGALWLIISVLLAVALTGML